MNINKVLEVEPGKPVAWMVFYKDDGQHVTTVYTLREMEYYAKQAYDIIPLTR